MAKFVALYEKPDDVEGFDEHYRSKHIPIVESWPGVQSVKVTRFSSNPRGQAPAFHVMVEAEFASDEEMAAALRSETGMASAKDAMAMAEQFGVSPTMLLGGDF